MKHPGDPPASSRRAFPQRTVTCAGMGGPDPGAHDEPTLAGLLAGFAAALLPGHPAPLGATAGAQGVNFALYSAHATRVWLCVFDARGREVARWPLPRRTNGVWHGLLPGARPGLCYGYRVEGSHEPARGHFFNPAKLLLDPYARRLAGRFIWNDDHLDNPADNAAYALRAIVDDPAGFDWQDDAPPRTPLEDSLIYEVHVRGATIRHPEVPERDRGRYLGLAAPAFVAHLQAIGVTALCLLPVHHALDERALIERDLVNYWGYNTIGFFTPTARHARVDPVAEFREMVRRLHAAGIEVLLDVVYNHTAEGGPDGPLLSFRGIDNASYYRLQPEAPGQYENLTGTGNTLDASHPRVIQLVLDSLRYWVEHMHVDGFRFDLAPVLGRAAATHGSAFSAGAPLLQAIAQDPVLARVKLIAEPWDVGPGGYQLGGFPPGWSEWNDRYRDQARAFWVRKAAYRGELAARMAGSRDIFQHPLRAPTASINYLAAHDGFTLHDVLSYDRRHNEANGEDNRDGSPNNHSWNCGAEGPTELLAVNALRGRLKRALLATLFLSQGVPMLLGGDELGRTQNGNNNAYNQDNPTSWFNWEQADPELIDYVARLAALRRRYPQLRARDWLSDAPADGRIAITWLNRRGQAMNARQWDERGRYAFGFLLSTASAQASKHEQAPTSQSDATLQGDGPDRPASAAAVEPGSTAAAAAPPAADPPKAGAPGAGVPATRLLVLINGEASDWRMPLPAGSWRPLLDTGQRDGRPADPQRLASGPCLLKARSLSLFEEAQLA